MGVIKRLSETLANKIAAGEVVERPASVVKELIENSIDAGASSVLIEIEEGGLKSIKVTDDGCGFAPEDCQIAFERHATSKIGKDADLFHIATLGFRGEALPSIAAVSYLELITSDDEHPGTHLVLQAGHIIAKGSAQSRKGTEIKVERLFYNTPARLKYLKSIHTELGKITEVVNRMALAYPNVRFTLIHEQKTLFQTNGSGNLSHVLAAVYGVRTAKAAYSFNGESLDFKVSGLAVHPQISRAGRQYVYIFINNRFIRNYPLFNSIMDGYHTLMMVGRYPICVIHIYMDPSLVDVNVHPAKLEARISKEGELCALISETIRKAFHRERLIPSVSGKPHVTPDSPQNEQQTLDFSPAAVTGPEIPEADIQKKQSDKDIFASEHVREPDTAFAAPEWANDGTADTDAEPREEEISDPSETNHPRKRMPKLYPIGQMHGTYIFAQNEDGLYIIDQHAAQERIKYEYFREKVGETAREVQELLVPMTFEFSASEYETIQEYHNYLQDIGLYFESFGARSLIIRSCPTWIPKGREEEMIHDLVNQIIETGKVSIKKILEKLAMMMACKRSIKANHYLRPDEIQALLDALGKAADPFTCPHGRPVLVHFTPYEMEKMFKRVQ
ncbi:DNA mismatch repair endonuclease MutL [Sporolactobacillus sp. CPB3-1]|uniref:DNA mismatch repair protein MutL n=1 Tax=Sporolactobacillus mangiferae TaxID=2940498 RepID=A0ABT0M7G9_9BACL|nr:DNA mismatch repair endonuclease MutL [Sporolactobacillus mangiferae]